MVFANAAAKAQAVGATGSNPASISEGSVGAFEGGGIDTHSSRNVGGGGSLNAAFMRSAQTKMRGSRVGLVAVVQDESNVGELLASVQGINMTAAEGAGKFLEKKAKEVFESRGSMAPEVGQTPWTVTEETMRKKEQAGHPSPETPMKATGTLKDSLKTTTIPDGDRGSFVGLRFSRKRHPEGGGGGPAVADVAGWQETKEFDHRRSYMWMAKTMDAAGPGVGRVIRNTWSTALSSFQSIRPSDFGFAGRRLRGTRAARGGTPFRNLTHQVSEVRSSSGGIRNLGSSSAAAQLSTTKSALSGKATSNLDALGRTISRIESKV